MVALDGSRIIGDNGKAPHLFEIDKRDIPAIQEMIRTGQLAAGAEVAGAINTGVLSHIKSWLLIYSDETAGKVKSLLNL